MFSTVCLAFVCLCLNFHLRCLWNNRKQLVGISMQYANALPRMLEWSKQRLHVVPGSRWEVPLKVSWYDWWCYPWSGLRFFRYFPWRWWNCQTSLTWKATLHIWSCLQILQCREFRLSAELKWRDGVGDLPYFGCWCRSTCHHIGRGKWRTPATKRQVRWSNLFPATYTRDHEPTECAF